MENSETKNEKAGELLKQAVDKYHQKQAVLAKSVGMTPRLLQNYFNGLFPKYKGDKVKALDNILGTNIFEMVYENKFPDDEPQPEKNFQQDLLNKKNSHNTFMVPFVSVKAQAGYTRFYDQVEFVQKLEQYPLLPGVNPRGREWRYFEVQGSSMEPELHDKDHVLCSLAPDDEWDNLRNFYVYVVVTKDMVVIKRVNFKYSLNEWEFISIDEINNPPLVLPVSNVLEVWVVRRHITSVITSTKMLQ